MLMEARVVTYGSFLALTSHSFPEWPFFPQYQQSPRGYCPGGFDRIEAEGRWRSSRSLYQSLPGPHPFLRGSVLCSGLGSDPSLLFLARDLGNPDGAVEGGRSELGGHPRLPQVSFFLGPSSVPWRFSSLPRTWPFLLSQDSVGESLRRFPFPVVL